MRKIVQLLSLALMFVVASTYSFGQTTDLFISEMAEGTSNNKYLEIYNGTGAAVDLGNYSLSSCSNGCDVFNEFDYPNNITFAPGTMLADGDVYLIAHPSADASILALADMTFTYLSNGDDAWALTQAGATASVYTIIDLVGDMQGDPGSGWDVAGITNGTQDHTLVRKPGICQGNPNELGSFGTSTATSEWIVLGLDDWTDMDVHTSTCAGSAQIGPCDELYFSEYIEGTSDNKAFEIYNPTGAMVDLSDYIVYRNDDGAATSTASLSLSGMLASGDVFVVANALASAGVLAEADITDAIASYTGNDALYLVKVSTGDTLDIIGEIGVDPGTGWTVGTGATNDFTLVRMTAIQQGSTDWSVGQTEWDVFPVDMIDSLGGHTQDACGTPCVPTASSITETACDTYTAPDGMTYTTSGMYTATIMNVAGCDSVITIDLTVNTSTMSSLTEVACDSFTLNGTTYMFSGTYTQTIANTVGCDSIITLNLDITPTPGAPVISGTTNYCNGDTPTALTASGTSLNDSLIISGVMDGTLPGGFPKMVELYVLEDIADLSSYGLGCANNGGGTDGEEFTFPAVSVTAGTYIHISNDSVNFNTFMGFFPDFTDGLATNNNGDDAIELFHNGSVIDVFGDINMDGTGTAWDYVDGWVYRKDNSVPNGGNFIVGEWDYSGVSAMVGQGTNAGAPNPFPTGTYSYAVPVTTFDWYDDAGLTNLVTSGTSYTPSITSGSISYYVTATSTGGSTCSSTATQVDVTFNPAPTVVANATATSVCEGESVTLTGSGADTYQWDNGITDGVAFNATVTETYIVIGEDQFGCTGVDSVEVTVTPAPATTLAAQPTVCDSDVAFTLSGGTPAGGTYSGTGVANGEFDPSVSGVGTFTITYSYTDTAGCTGTSTADLVVNDCASIEQLEAEGVIVYPNPAADVLNVKSTSKIESIEIVDLSGMIVANGTENTVSVAHLAAGMYVINLTTEAGMITKTFVKK